MQDNSKVFLTGIPGIGKSEFIKAYANKYRKEYSDILYFRYTGDLKEMVTVTLGSVTMPLMKLDCSRKI